MSRSIKKGPYVHPKLARKVEKAISSNSREVIRTWARASMIMPDMLGLTIAVHDGRRHVPIFITENMVGHKLDKLWSIWEIKDERRNINTNIKTNFQE